MKQLLLIFSCLGSSLLAHAQFNALLYSLTPLTEECGTGAPLGPESYGVIYWDQNSNGPDQADQPVPVGDLFGQANFNTFPINGESILGIPGTFYTDPAFTISTNTPQPSRYYVKVEIGGVVWTSVVFTILDGLRDYDLSEGWSCYGSSCDMPSMIVLGPEDFNGESYSGCLSVCAMHTTTICIGPLPQNRRPVVDIHPGCNYGIIGSCDVECQLVQFSYNPDLLYYDSQQSQWCLNFFTVQTGCVCVNAIILPVVESSFEAVARDKAALISWATASETGVDYFRLKRDDQVVHTCAGSNSATGATYSYLDENLANGQTYSYSLETVNMDGSVDTWSHVATATPSSAAAVITEYALHQNYPNPFNPNTSIVFDLVEDNFVVLTVYNLAGQEVATLVNGTMNAGRHTVNFDATNLTSGLYFYTVKIGNEFTATKKMLLVK